MIFQDNIAYNRNRNNVRYPRARPAMYMGQTLEPTVISGGGGSENRKQGATREYAACKHNRHTGYTVAAQLLARFSPVRTLDYMRSPTCVSSTTTTKRRILRQKQSLPPCLYF